MNWLANLETATTSMPVWFEVLAGAALRGCLVLLAAFTVVTAAGRASAASRHFVWMAAFASLVALPLVSVLTPSWRLQILPWRAGTGIERRLHPNSSMELTDGSADSLAGRNGFVPPHGFAASGLSGSFARDGDTAFSTQNGISGRLGITVWELLGLLWGIGLLATLVPLFLGLARRRRLEMDSRDVSNGKLGSLARQLAVQLQMPVTVKVLLHRESVMPVSWGVTRAMLLLPAEAVRWSRHQFGGSAVARVGARETPRLPGTATGARGLRLVLVQPAGLDGGAKTTAGSGKRLRRLGACRWDQTGRLCRRPAGDRKNDASRNGREIGSHRDGDAFNIGKETSNDFGQPT